MNQNGYTRISADTVHTDGQGLGSSDCFQIFQKFILDNVGSRNRLPGPPVHRLSFPNFPVHGDFCVFSVYHSHRVGLSL